jgi:hypothetical protein
MEYIYLIHFSYILQTVLDYTPTLGVNKVEEMLFPDVREQNNLIPLL